jgi:hypothetical protein
MEHHEKSIGKSCFKWCIIDLWGCYRDMGHGQYLAYSSKSSIFEECIIVFQVLDGFGNIANAIVF